MSHKDNADLRNTGEGGWFYAEHELFSVFAPLIGADGVAVYMAMCRLIPLAAVDSRYPVTMDAIEEASQVSKSQANRKKRQIVALGMVEETRSSSRRPSTYRLHSLRRLALLGVGELRKRLGVPQGDTEKEALAIDASEEARGRAARSRAGRDVPTLASREEAYRFAAKRGRSGESGVPPGDTEFMESPSGLNEAIRASRITIPGTPVSQKEGLVSQIRASVSQGDTPFNELEEEDRKTVPPTPKGGEGSTGPVLVNPDCRPGEAGWALNVGIASRWAAAELGQTKEKFLAVLASQLELRCRSNRRESLPFVAELLVGNWRQYEVAWAAGRLKWGPWKISNFVADAHWQNPLMWPWKQDERPSGASVGRYVEPTEEEMAAQLEERSIRICDWIHACREQVRSVLGECATVKRLSEIAQRDYEGEDELQIDKYLQDADDAMFDVVFEAMEPAENEALRVESRKFMAESCKHMTSAALREKTQRGWLIKRLYERRGLPRLSLLYMGPV